MCVGGQCILAVDVPGPSASEEQQGPLLSAALETQTSHPAQCRPDQGNIFPGKEVFTKQFSSVHCMLELFNVFAPDKVVDGTIINHTAWLWQQNFDLQHLFSASFR